MQKRTEQDSEILNIALQVHVRPWTLADVDKQSYIEQQQRRRNAFSQATNLCKVNDRNTVFGPVPIICQDYKWFMLLFMMCLLLANM